MIIKNNVREVLLKYVRNPKKWFYWYHNTKRLYRLNEDDWQFTDHGNGGVSTVLIDFFDAILDEVRLKKANSFADFALYISDDKDLGYFRGAISKKEFTADVDYNKQRDHAVHTLYNYILGWYIFDNIPKVYNELCNHFGSNSIYISQDSQKSLYNKDDCDINENKFNDHVCFVNQFGDVWPIVSLLHDIGYILEGTISSASPQVENDRVSNGSKIIHDYFNHWFWKDFDIIDFRAAKNISRSIGCMVPDFKQSRSLASLGDHLCDIGSCENIRIRRLKEYETCLSKTQEKVNISLATGITGIEEKKIQNIKLEISKIDKDYDWNRDAFSLWKKYYKSHNNYKMNHLINILNQEYKDLMWKGSSQGYRSLNHGVCSGLVLLQALSFFFDFMWGCERIKWPEFKTEQEKFWPCNRISRKSFEYVRTKVIEKNIPGQITQKGGYNTDYFYQKALWATASTAVHDMIQSDNWKIATIQYFSKNEKHLKKDNITTYNDLLTISLDDDPLTFLGILVDILQQWDRYSVSGESAFTGMIPVQSNEVCLVLSEKNPMYKKVVLKYPDNSKESDHKLLLDLKKDLNRCLDNWNDIIDIDDYPPNIVVK